MDNSALTLFQFGGLEKTGNVGSSFHSTPVFKVGKDGSKTEIGETWSLRKAKDAKTLMGLQPGQKEEFAHNQADAKILAFRQIKQLVNSLDETTVGLERFVIKRDPKTGLEEFTLRARRVHESLRRGVITVAKVAKAWGCTEEEAEIKLGLRAAPVVDVTSTKEPAIAKNEEKQLEGKELTQEEKDAIELARMEAEEQHKAAVEDAKAEAEATEAGAKE